MKITIDRDLAVRVLEALEEATSYTSTPSWSPSMTEECNDAITDLTAALEQVASTMTANRAQYFMERFKHEEKLLGPNEQAALDYVIAMLAAAPQPVQEPGWQPIETAPKDGNWVLVWTWFDCVEIAKWIYTGREDGAWYSKNSCDLRPTRWMSLPPGPVQEPKP